MMKKTFYLVVVVLIVSTLLLAACNTAPTEVEAMSSAEVNDRETNEVMPVESADADDAEDDEDEVDRPENWGEASHDKSADADYDLVFPQDEVNRIDITISAETWEAMQANMTDLFGEQGDGSMAAMGGGMRQAPGGNQPPNAEQGQAPGGNQPPDNAQMPADRGGMRGGGGGMGGGEMGGPALSSADPDYFTVTVEFGDDVWTNVGMRYRGNSTLRTSWQMGTDKISFMLDFDEFEDYYPEIDDQRFYGFKKLVFSSNSMDESLLREKVTADIFRDAGVAAAETAFYEVYVDYGEGPVYFGLYTAIEMIDDTVIETQFDDDDGNVYKPEGTGATFADGTFDEESFEKLTNQDEADWSDIEALFDALHADTRLSDPAQWRADLEDVFDVDTFLNWLAVDTLIQNWDTYGVMSHNYYLYNDPDTGLLTWIPWDNNMALSSTAGMGNPKEFSQSNIGDNWPLISYLLDDEVYYQSYLDHIQNALDTVFYPERMEEIYRYYHEMISPCVLAETPGNTQLNNVGQFENSLDNLIAQVNERYQAGQSFLESQ